MAGFSILSPRSSILHPQSSIREILRWLMNGLLTDLRYGIRLLLKDLGFTIVAVLSLAVGIGATTAMFSVVDATLLKPLAYFEPERLVMVWEQTPETSNTIPTVATFLAWREHQQVFSHLAAITSA